MSLMDKWAEVVPDTILVLLFIYLLIRLATSPDALFKRPFYVLFITTGIYIVISVLVYLIMVQFLDRLDRQTGAIYKTSLAATTFGGVGSTVGKALIALHRYFVLRTRDFSEKNLSSTVIYRLLILQFIFSVAVTIPIWISSSFTMNGDVIVNLSKENTVIMKAITISIDISYICCNGLCTILSSRELIRLRQMMGTNSNSNAIIVQQRNLFIIVTVCSISHFIKALQQSIIAFATYAGLQDLYQAIWPLYPLVNGLASYAAPICLVIFSSKVRARLIFRRTTSCSKAGTITLR